MGNHKNYDNVCHWKESNGFSISERLFETECGGTLKKKVKECPRCFRVVLLNNYGRSKNKSKKMEVPEYESFLQAPDIEIPEGLQEKIDDVESELDCLSAQIDNVEIRMRRMYKELKSCKHTGLKDVCLAYLKGIGAYDHLCSEVNTACEKGKECLKELEKN